MGVWTVRKKWEEVTRWDLKAEIGEWETEVEGQLRDEWESIVAWELPTEGKRSIVATKEWGVVERNWEDEGEWELVVKEGLVRKELVWGSIGRDKLIASGYWS